jgi:filamentous hemagglutinin family protein
VGNQRWGAGRTRVGLGVAVIGLLLVVQGQAIAQLRPIADTAADRDLGTTVVPLNAQIDLIRNGTRSVNGANLFHSFQEFNIGEGRSAYFIAPDAGIENILARVTGKNASEILGRLGTAQLVNGRLGVSNANLFLLNPNGIVFGENASLDVDRSFAATTANAIRFGDRGIFSATNPTNAVSLLTVNPSAYLFSQVPTGNIVNRSINRAVGLRVPDGENLMFLGGNVALEGGGLRAQGGRVEVGAVAGVGQIEILTTGALEFLPGLERGNVALTVGGRVDASTANEGDAGNVKITSNLLRIDGRDSLITTSNFGGGNAGEITINAENLLINQGALFTRIPEGRTGNSGKIDVQAETVSLVDAFITTANRGNGNGGDIIFKVGSINATNGTNFTASVFGTGDSGSITIDARKNINFDGFSVNDGELLRTAIFSNIENNGNGKAGDVRLKANSISITNGAALYSNIRKNGIGQGGNIYIDGNSLLVSNGAELNSNVLGQGVAGNIIVSAGDVVFDGGDAFSNIGFNASKGTGGDISITANTLYMTGSGQINVASQGPGDAGNIIVQVRNWMVLDGASSSIFGTGIFSNKGGIGTEGQGGNINISTGSLLVQNGAQIQTAAAGGGASGNITIQTHGAVIFRGGRIIDRGLSDLTFEPSAAFSNVQNQGTRGGNILINSDSLTVDQGAEINAETFLGSQGNAGNIFITANNDVTIDGVGLTGDSSKVSSASGILGFGAGGNIDIKATTVRVSNGGVITAQTNLFGVRGGDITIGAKTFEAIKGGQVLANSDGSGPAGTITLTATDQIHITGSDPTYATRLAQFGTAVAPISPNSGLYVRSTRTGPAGNILLTTPRLTLDQQGRIDAQSSTVSGGNLFLTVPSLLLLRNGSQISATAGTANPQAPGDGGNININSRFIVAIPKENSDITANATQGRGGNVTIASQGIFGLQFRPQLTPFSDITASSDFGLSGTVLLNTPDNFGLQNGLNQLPNTLIDTNRLLANSCIVRTPNRNNSFYITGSSSLPLRPGDTPVTPYPTGALQPIPSAVVKSPGISSATRPVGKRWKKGDPIVEPQDIYQLPDGQFILSRECSSN